MYIPKYSSVNDTDFLKEFIISHSFGTLLSSTNNDLSANHYPFLISSEGNELILWTHLAKSNPQWNELQNDCLIIFTGPHAYISPTYYINKLNVPTWNYTSVHAKCSAQVVSDINLEKELMNKLVHFYEKSNQTNWNYDLPEIFHEKLLKSIVWIKFRVINLEGKFKLSQNRDQSDYENVIKNLIARESENNLELVNYMKQTSPYQKK
jgi:transcriptional regulator